MENKNFVEENESSGKKVLGHPRGLFYLFFAELWERFSFYGMRALLTLYMVNELFEAIANKDEIAYSIYAAYGAMVYTTPVIGGIIADKLIGYRRAITTGAIFMALGHFTLAFSHQAFFYGALALLIIGNGFFKPNISTLVGTLYSENDPKRDAGFTIFYMGINLGAFSAPLLCGWLGETYGWHYGFGLAGFGMLLGLLVFWDGIKKNIFGGQGLPPDIKLLHTHKWGLKLRDWVSIIAALLVPVIALMMYHGPIPFAGGSEAWQYNGYFIDYLVYAIALGILFYVIYIMWGLKKMERERVLVIIIITLFMTVFWAFFEQGGSSLTLFADRNVDLQFITASQSNAINPMFIIIFAIPLSYFWVLLSRKRVNPYTPVKYAMGMAQLGLGFFIFSLSSNFADTEGQVPFIFLIIGYFFITTGELFTSPIGISKVTELSPKKIGGLMMGVFWLSLAFGHFIAGYVAQLTATNPSDAEGEISGMESLEIYTGVYQEIAYVAFGFSILTLILSPLIKKWMHGVH